MAQQQMACWTTWIFWTSAAGVIVSAFALLGLFRSLRQTRQAIGDAREIGEFQTQAYVLVEKADFGKSNGIILTIRNTGQTPATHFSVAGTVKRVKRGTISKSLDFTSTNFKTWSALGSGTSLTVNLGNGNFEDVGAFWKQGFPADEALIVSGRVVYSTIFNHDHETQFGFYADHDAPDHFRRPVANLRVFWRIPSKPKAARSWPWSKPV